MMGSRHPVGISFVDLLFLTPHTLPQSPEVILPLLSCTCSAVEADDRRYVFQCVRGAKVVVLQAMGERDRDEVCKYKFQALQGCQDIKCHS